MKTIKEWLEADVFIRTFCAMMILSFMVIAAIGYYQNQLERNRLEYLALSTSNKISEVIPNLLYKTEALAALTVQGDGKIRDFERIAATIVNDRIIRNLIVAADGVVSQVYPLESNQKVLGYDLLNPEEEGNKEAIMARNTGKLIMGGPFNLVQGGKALVGRMPVIMDDQYGKGKYFWGLVSVTLNYPQALEAVHLEELYKQGYACEIWRVSPDTKEKQIILHSNTGPLVNPVERNFNVLNANWTISVAPINSWYLKASLAAYSIIAIIASFLIAFLFQNYSEVKAMKIKMESIAMTDLLTGIPNRRYLLDQTKALVKEKKADRTSFTLCFLDFNGFKLINDNYGHEVGDMVLVEATKRIKKCLRKSDLLARVGGDEFVFILNDICIERTKQLLSLINEELEQPITIGNSESIVFSASIGVAKFPENGKTTEELLAYADKHMYRAKKEYYCEIKNDDE